MMSSGVAWSGERLEEWKYRAVDEALELYNGNRTHTAWALGVSLRALRNWIANEPRLQRWRSSKVHDA